MPIDLLDQEEVSVQITYYVAGTPRTLDFLDCYAYTNPKLSQIEVRQWGDPSNMPPRVTIPLDLTPIVEHHGKHPVPEASKPSQKSLHPPTVNPLDMEALERRRAEREPAPAAPEYPTLAEVVAKQAKPLAVQIVDEIEAAEKKRKAWDTFEQEVVPAAEQPAEKKFLEEVPKAEPATVEESGSDRNTLRTPSGRFLTRLPLELEPGELKQRIEELAEPSTEMAGLNQPYAPGELLNRAARRKHKKPKQLPGAALLVAAVLSLSVFFRHPSY